MGSGIAHVFALAAIDVVLVDVQEELLQNALAGIQKNMQRQLSKEKITAEQMQGAVARIQSGTSYQAFSECQLVVEAASERKDIKQKIFQQLSEVASDDCILASNTSTISLTEIASFAQHPSRVIGMHFMNPVPMMQLVEVIKALQTSVETTARVLAVCDRIGKVPMEVHDMPGFGVNRILIPMINEAIFAVSEGVADAETIDQVMKLGAGQPMGPLALADLIGLDVVLYIMDVLHQDFADSKYRAAPLLRKMVAAGRLGKKTGHGFHQYGAGGKP